ncbi:response regulator transcription factor [Ensifer sp.]|jgi:two-component system response regulator QseB|uniref:response regulator transcription factor n=1 Tax=Ensifer sp. TaxID=1872086 RepID=UPI002E15CBC8|nr:response regulator transcription factor [Ensifer sp.]
MRILIVEDDDILRDGLKVGLALAGFTTDAVATCDGAATALAANGFDAVVLDLMLPDGSGLDILRDLRAKQSEIPVLLLTARDTVRDRVAGLDSGADDYLGKPFDLDEVAARLRALSRRSSGRATAALEWSTLRLDPARQSLEKAGRPVHLSRREYAILHMLMAHPGVIFSKAKLEDKLYGWQEEIESNAVEVHIHHLRNKLGPGLIETVRGIGYRLGGAG